MYIDSFKMFFIVLVNHLFGAFIGYFLARRKLRQREKEMSKAIELLYSRNIDRTIRNLKDKEFEETANANEDKL